MEGSVSTPFFKQPFDEISFKPLLALTLLIAVPESIKKKKNMTIVINVEYDLAEFSSNEYLSITGIIYRDHGRYSTGEIALKKL